MVYPSIYMGNLEEKSLYDCVLSLLSSVGNTDDTDSTSRSKRNLAFLSRHKDLHE